MDKETIIHLAIILLALIFIGLFIGSPIYQRYKINKFNEEKVSQEIARISFMMEFPEKLKEYGYPEGTIPDFSTDGTNIWFEDGRNPELIYKTDMELNKLNEFYLEPSGYSNDFIYYNGRCWVENNAYNCSTGELIGEME